MGNLTAENGKNFAKIRQLETSLEEASAVIYQNTIFLTKNVLQILEPFKLNL